MKKNFIPSVNFHLTKACNMKCKYCFAGFRKVNSELTLESQKKIIYLLRQAGFDKINFVGGEPFLIKHLEELICYAKRMGFYVSVVTNGSLITDEFLNNVAECLDLIGVSIDSLNAETNKKIGRQTKKLIPDENYYTKICNKIKEHGINLKINTVVSKANVNESFISFIRKVSPFRWKVFQVLAIEGENDIEDFKITKTDFNKFVYRHKETGEGLVSEPNDVIKGSYIMIDPKGCFFDNTKGKYNVSDSILDVGVANALKQIDFSLEKFLSRNGNYYQQLKQIAI